MRREGCWGFFFFFGEGERERDGDKRQAATEGRREGGSTAANGEVGQRASAQDEDSL